MSLPKIFTVPYVPMSRNARDRAHWTERDKELQDFTLLLEYAHGKNAQAEGGKRRMVEIVFCKMRGPAADPDNLVARAKVPLDALVKRGWLFDDSPKYVDLRVREQVTGKRGQTIIGITEIVTGGRPSPIKQAKRQEPQAELVATCPDGAECERGCRGGCYRATYGELAP